MLKFIYSTTVLPIVGTLVVAPIAFSQITTAKAQHLPTANLDNNKPNCYMHTAHGRTLNLDSICGKPNILAPAINPNLAAEQNATTNSPLSQDEIKRLLDETCQAHNQCSARPSDIDIAVIKSH